MVLQDIGVHAIAIEAEGKELIYRFNTEASHP